MSVRTTARRTLAAVAAGGALAAALVTAPAAAAAAAAEPASGVHGDGLRYGSCRENVRIHRSPSVGSARVGICAGGDRIRSDRGGAYSGVNCNGVHDVNWEHVRDLRTNVVGWVPTCFIRWR